MAASALNVHPQVAHAWASSGVNTVMGSNTAAAAVGACRRNNIENFIVLT